MVDLYEEPYQYTIAVLCDGSRVFIRTLCPDDAEDLARYFRQLDPVIADQRFHGFCRQLSREELWRMTNPNLPTEVSLVATLPRVGDHRGQIIGEGLYAANRASRVAELGFSVAKEHQRRGIGNLLLDSLLGWARHAKLVRMDADVLASNHNALRFLARRRFRSVSHPVCGVKRVSLLLEALPEEHSWANDNLTDKIKRRAHELYLARGATAGRELDDWLAAERDLCRDTFDRLDLQHGA